MRRITKLERDLADARRDARAAAQEPRPQRARHRRDRRLHERRQVDRCSTASPQPACSSRTGCSPRSIRPRAACRFPAASPCCCPTRSASSATCRTGSSRRSRARSRSPRWPTTWCTSSTPARPTRAARSTPCARCSARSTPRPCPSCWCSTRPTSRPATAKELVDGHPGSVAISASTGEGIDVLLQTLGDRLRVLAVVHELRVPYDRGDVLASIHREGEVVSVGRRRRRRGPSGRACRTRRPDGSSDFVVARDGRRLMVGFVPPPYPYDRLDRLRPLDRSARGRHRRPLDRHAVRPAAAGGRWTRWRRATPSGRYPPSIGTPAFRDAARRWMRRRFDIDVPAGADRGVDRHEGVRRRPCRSGCTSATRPATPCCTRRSPTRPTRWARSSPAVGRCRFRRCPTDAWISTAIIRRRCGAGARAVGQQPGEPDRRARRPRRGGGMGTGARRAGVLRRVLRRVHLGRTGAGRSSSHGTDGVVAVHSLSKRSNLAGCAGRLLRR